jgi:hypothetical protein
VILRNLWSKQGSLGWGISQTVGLITGRTRRDSICVSVCVCIRKWACSDKGHFMDKC